MNRYFISRLFTFLFFFCCLFGLSFSQSKKELQQKKQQLQKEIEYTNQLLKETATTKKTSLNQLRKLNKKISTRQSLIATMESEINLLNDSIELQVQKIDSLEGDLVILKEEYAEIYKFPHNKSPLPPFAIPEFPVVLKLTSPFLLQTAEYFPFKTTTTL